MNSLSGSCRNLAALLEGGGVDLQGGGPLSYASRPLGPTPGSRVSLDNADNERINRIIIVSNQLPIKAKRNGDGSWDFEWDKWGLMKQAGDGISSSTMKVLYVGCLPADVPPDEEERVAKMLSSDFNAFPVFIPPELREKSYRGFCKQQLWPLFHYLLPLMPKSAGRFDPDLWSAYVKANQEFSLKLMEVVNESGGDFVWVHDYHLLVLPSLLRSKFNKVRCGLFLHSPFPSSEIFRTFPKREEVLRSMLNADLIGFHTFDYARHFLSCCSRVLGLEHQPRKGSIILEYYGRNVGIKIMPTGVKPQLYLDMLLDDPDTKWRRGELLAKYHGKTVLVGVDDLDIFKGIELKLEAVERVLRQYPELRGQLVLVQITNAPRADSPDLLEVHQYIMHLVERINTEYGSGDYKPIVWETMQGMHDRVAYYSIADVAVVTATRDGMNLVPYEYVTCRQGAEESPLPSMLVVSEFVGCSPSLSGAIRVNPWCSESVAEGIHSAIRMSMADRLLRHEKHWRYISQHTVMYWAQSFLRDLQQQTLGLEKMHCIMLGLGLKTFKTVMLTPNFQQLDNLSLMSAYEKATRRVILLDYDGTLIVPSTISNRPTQHVLDVLKLLCSNPANTVFVISGRARTELAEWFDEVPNLGLAAEHGFFYRRRPQEQWLVKDANDTFAWKELVLPILQSYQESTDGSYIESKSSALVWHYRDADPDFGHWQAKELLDHLEGVLSNQPVEVASGQAIVEVKPQGVSKGAVVARILSECMAGGAATDFVLCVGDDRSDEDMFQQLDVVRLDPQHVYACTVGQKPSKARFYVNEPTDVLSALEKLCKL